MGPRQPRRSLVAAIGTIAIVASACGSGSTSSPASSTDTSGPSAAPTATPMTAEALCGSAGFDEAAVYELAKQEGQMHWVESFDLDRAQPYIDQFEKDYPGIKVDYNITPSDGAQRYIAEHNAGQTSIDVFHPNIDYEAYSQAGMVTDSTDTLVAAGVPADTIFNGSAQDEYLVLGLSINKDLVTVSDVPKTWNDILDPKWKGLLSVDDRLRPFIYATPFWGEQAVDDFLLKLKDQDPKFRSGESAATELLLAGESHIVVGAFLGSILEHHDDPWQWVDLDEVYSVESEGKGPTYSPDAPDPCASKLFIYWWFGANATKIRDDTRFRGDPRPGTNTGPSKYLEQHGTTVKVAPADPYDKNFREWQDKYLQVMGVSTGG